MKIFFLYSKLITVIFFLSNSIINAQVSLEDSIVGTWEKEGVIMGGDVSGWILPSKHVGNNCRKDYTVFFEDKQLRRWCIIALANLRLRILIG